MYNKIKETYKQSLEKIRELFRNIRNQEWAEKAVSGIIRGIKKNHKKSSWVNVAVLITNILGFLAYCAISPVLAEYQREKGIRNFSMAAIAVIIAIIIWELVCLAGWKKLKKLGGFLYRFGGKVRSFCRIYFWPIAAAAVILFLVTGGCLYGYSHVTYCTCVAEIYGIPTGIGEELKSREEREKCAAYWKIKDYPFRRVIELTYVEPYKQLEVMKESSTAYGMAFFQPTARIRIKYERDKEKYLSFNQSSYEVARKNGFREPTEVSYYSSNGKQVLKLKKNKYGKYDITDYSSVDMPQLLNSTLLYTQNADGAESGRISQQIEVTYNADGLPETRRLSPKIYNANGINGEYYVYDQNRRLTTLYYLDINGEFVCNKQGIMMVDFQYEDNGNLHSIRYYGGEDREKKTAGCQGVFCERFSYDSYGNLKERSQRDVNENLCSDVNGVCMYRYHYNYDTDSMLVKEEFLGFDGEPVLDNKFHSTAVEFQKRDENEKREILVLLDPVGSSVAATEREAYSPLIAELKNFLEAENQQDRTMAWMEYRKQIDAIASWKQDGGNDQTVTKTDSESDGGPDSDSAQQVEGAALSKQEKREKDETVFSGQLEMKPGERTPVLQDGRQDPQTESVESEDHAEIQPDEEADIIRNYVSIRYSIDRQGCVFEKAYCGGSEKPVACEDGYAIIRFDYDGQKRITHERYLDDKSVPCCINGGYAVVRKSYESDRGDNSRTIEYLINDEELVRNRELGYAYVEYTRTLEDKNMLVCKRYFDEEKKPVPLPGLGYSMAQEYYDERNCLIWEAYYAEKDGEDGQYERVGREDCGAAEIWYEYEDSGNRIRELYKDVNKQPVNRTDTGYAAVCWKYEGGQMVDCHYEGNRDRMLRNAVDRKTGIAGIRYTYESGRKVREEYYDTEGNPSFRTDRGCAAEAFEYNDKGGICEESYYGLDGEAVLRKDTGYARVVYQDNEYGQRISVRFYGTDKQPVISTEDHCAGYDYAYDDEGNEEYVKYIGLDGKPMTRRDLGYAQVRYKYNEHGKIKEGRYLDTKGKLTVRKDRGYAYYTNDYDDNGNWKESCYYIAETIPALRQDTGYFRIANEYDDDGRLISQRFYGTDKENPVISTKYCCAGFTWKYDYDYDNNFGFEYEGDEKGVRKTTTYIGPDGKPMLRKDLGYARAESVYDRQDREISAVYYDADGKLTRRKERGYAAFRDVYENGSWVKSLFYDENGGLVSRSDTGYAAIINEYDEYGQRICERYYNERWEPTISTKFHCAGFLYEYDERGNQVYAGYLDLEGKLMTRRDLGYAQVKIGYDNIGNKISEAYFDTKGQPAVRKEGGYASYRDMFDRGRWVEGRYYDKRGRLTLRSDKGYAVIKNEYDEYGQRTAQTYYDASDVLKPVIGKEYHCAGIQFGYDDMGNEIYAGYLDLDGNLMARRDLGYAQITREYDRFGNKTQEAYYDIWGNPAIDKEKGYSGYKNDYEVRRMKKTEYFIDKKVKNKSYTDNAKVRQSVENGRDSIDKNGQDGKPVLRKDTGYAKVEYEYDEYGQEKRSLYYGANGEPVISTMYLCAGFAYAYDEKGNKTDIYYLGLEGEPVVRRDLGITHIHKEYDSLGNLERESYFDHDEPAVYDKRGYVSYENILVNGRIIETRYLDTAGCPVMNGEKGYAGVRYEYDQFGQCSAELYYGADGRPVISKKDFCGGCEYEYDEAGNQTGICYLDQYKIPMIRRDLGYACVRMNYDECGNKTGESYYDADGGPAVGKDGGNASCEYVYDGGNCVEWRYFDREDKLMMRRDTGCAAIRYAYDDYGQCIGEAYYDTKEGTVFRKDYQCAGRQFGYDDRGNQTEFRCIGLDGNPMMWGDLGYAQIKCEFDHFNNKRTEIYLDTNGDPVVRQELGYAQTRWEYDEAGKMSKEACFDKSGQPAVRKDGGYAYCEFYYDDKERSEERRYFDAEGNLILRSDEGCAIVRYFYDKFGQNTEVDYWSAEYEKVVNRKTGCAKISYEYDERGNNTYIRYWNSDGKVSECENAGIAMEHMVYDEYGYIIAREYYIVDPEDDTFMICAVRKDLGYARINYVYEGNVWIRTEYLDAEGNYMVPKGIGYAVYEREYNDQWLVEREAYYDAEGNLINRDNGAAVIEYTYDKWGYIEDRIYYDQAGEAFFA